MVQRITNTLLQEKLLDKEPLRGGLRIGKGIHALAATRQDIVELIRPHLVMLSRETLETVDLAEFRHDHMIFVDQIIGRHRLRAVAAIGGSQSEFR